MRLILLPAFLIAGVAFAGSPFMVHGHRGAASLKPENTLPSFEQAIRDGADYVELDVAVTRDNVLVVSHDPVTSANVCTGEGGVKPIRELTLEQVRAYDCGTLNRSKFSHWTAVPNTRIPTLDEVFDLAKTSRIKYNVEIKSDPKHPEYQPAPEEFARMVAASIHKHKLEKRVLVQSFDVLIVKAMVALEPKMPVATLYYGPRNLVEIAKETGVRIVTPYFKQVTPEAVKEAHAAGIQIVPWTVDTQEEWARLIDAGVDGIITNSPGELVGYLKQKGLK